MRVAHVDVEGQTLFSTAELLAAIPIVPGDPWNPARIEEGRRAIERLYARRGYQGATADADVTRRDREVSVIYRIVEGPQTRIGRILLRGLAVTKEETVRRQLGFEPGDVFDPERLAAARRRLERPPAFATVDVGPPRPPPAPFADVDVLVAEQKPWRFELGLGYDTAVGVSGYLELSHDNLFGTARSAGIRIKEAIGGEAIQRLDHVDLIYREPWIPGTPWQGQIELYGERTENLGYDLQRVGFRGLDRRRPPESARAADLPIPAPLPLGGGASLRREPGSPGSGHRARYRSDREPDAGRRVGLPRRPLQPPPGQLPPGVPGDGAPGPRRERRVREGRALDELVLLVAAAHRVRGLGTAGAGRPVRRDAEPADRGPFLHGRQHERTRVSREPVGPAGRGREPGRRRGAGSPEPGVALSALALGQRSGVRRCRHGDAGGRRPELLRIQVGGRGRVCASRRRSGPSGSTRPTPSSRSRARIGSSSI